MDKITHAICVRGGNLYEERSSIRRFEDFLCKLNVLASDDIKCRALFSVRDVDVNNVFRTWRNIVSECLTGIETAIKEREDNVDALGKELVEEEKTKIKERLFSLSIPPQKKKISRKKSMEMLLKK